LNSAVFMSAAARILLKSTGDPCRKKVKGRF
jgi:hypothetical protein